MAWKGSGTEENQEIIKTRIGQNTDATGTTTLFARLKQIYDYLASNLSSTRAAKIDNLDATISSRQASWGATATHSSRIDTTISSRAAQITVDTINTNVGSNTDTSSATGSVHGKLKDIKSAIIASSTKPIARNVTLVKSGISYNSSKPITEIGTISGSGILTLSAISFNSSASSASFRLIVTIDGVEFISHSTATINYANVFYPFKWYDSQYVQLPFRNGCSIAVEGYASSGSGMNFTGSVHIIYIEN